MPPPSIQPRSGFRKSSDDAVKVVDTSAGSPLSALLPSPIVPGSLPFASALSSDPSNGPLSTTASVREASRGAASSDP
jgi:hypothetical protein